MKAHAFNKKTELTNLKTNLQTFNLSINKTVYLIIRNHIHNLVKRELVYLFLNHNIFHKYALQLILCIHVYTSLILEQNQQPKE